MRSAVRSSKTQERAVTGKRFYQQKVARDLAPNIAALLGEGLDTAAIERLYVKHPALLNATHRKFTSALEGLRRLAALLPDEPCAVQAPAGATQLGVALWRYPGAAARLLLHGSLASRIDGNLQLRQQLGVSPAQTARSIFQASAVLALDLQRAEAMVVHLQRLRASGELSAKQGERRGAATCHAVIESFGAGGRVGAHTSMAASFLRCMPFCCCLCHLTALPACMHPV